MTVFEFNTIRIKRLVIVVIIIAYVMGILFHENIVKAVSMLNRKIHKLNSILILVFYYRMRIDEFSPEKF